MAFPANYIGPAGQIVSKNQFGEESVSAVISSTGFSQALPAKSGVTAISAISTADATDLPTAIALANATKAAFNSLLAALKATS